MRNSPIRSPAGLSIASASVWAHAVRVGLGLLLVLQMAAVHAVATVGDIDIGTDDSYVLTRSFTYLEDTSARMALEDVLQPEAQARFQPVVQGALAKNFGVTHSAIWLKVRLHARMEAPVRWMLEVRNAPLDRMDLFVSNAGKGYEHQSGGDSLPFAERPVPHRNHVKPVDVVPGGETTLYLRVQSEGNVTAPMTLWQPAALWHSDQKTYALYSLYFGLLIGLVLYNLLLYFSVRDVAYLVYVLFAACIGLSQSISSGLATQFLWPGAVWWSDVSINVVYGAIGIFGVLFARSFLASRRTMPRLDRLMQTLAGLWLATAVLSMAVSHRAAILMVTVLALVTVVTVVAAGGISIWRRHPGAPYFGLAWGVLLLGIFVQSLHNYGVLPSNPVLGNAVLIGSALEMVLLSFALANRINVTRREKELAQVQLGSKQAMVRVLQQSQERYRAVIEHVGEGMVVVQNEGIVFVNARATEILEASKAAIIAEGVVGRIHADDRAALIERVRSRLAGQALAARCQVRLEQDGKPLKWLEFGDAMLPWDGEQGLLIFFLDVTERHTAELETRATLQQQQELNELRSRFIAMTSHEFRTPLAAILSAQDLLKTFGDKLPASQKLEVLDMIESGVHRMTRMLERVLLLGRVETQLMEFKPQPLDLQALCRALVDEAASQHPDSTCKLVLRFDAPRSDGLYDEKLLHHIFGNLLSNAIKYSPAGGEVCFNVFADGPHTVFEVSDQGIGVPADELAKLFESFHRASNVGGIRGTGLGLAIVKQSVELHGGTIAVRSALGQGSCFTVRLDATG